MYFHTKYARSEIVYLITNHPNYKIYTPDIVLKKKDRLIICIYLHLLSMTTLCNLTHLYKTNKTMYRRIYAKKFSLINKNINCDTGEVNGIYHPDLKKLFERKNSKILLYNSWETRNLYRCYPVLLHYCSFHKIPPHKLLFSMTDHIHTKLQMPPPRVISYDWQYIMAKRDFSQKRVISSIMPKKKHLLCMNNRCNRERFCMAAYLFSHYKKQCHISFRVSKRSDTLDNNFILYAKKYLSQQEINSFRAELPMLLDGNNNVKSYKDFLEESYIMLIFETNIVAAPCQQISEKTYKPILAGIPFILWSKLGGILQHLHSLGFKTFRPYIDESYDDKTKSYTDRYSLMMKEVTRICSLEDDKIMELYQNCLPIVNHNLSILGGSEGFPSLPI